MSDNFFGKNPAEYTGNLIKERYELREALKTCIDILEKYVSCLEYSDDNRVDILYINNKIEEIKLLIKTELK